MILDELPRYSDYSGETVVIGAGPVGISFALALARRGKRVLVLESGGRHAEQDRSGDFALSIADPRLHAPGHLATRQGLGGTSSVWGAGCVPWDPIDCQPRDYLPLSGMPISHEKIIEHYPEAARMIGIGEIFTNPKIRLTDPREIDPSQVMLLGATPNLAKLHKLEIDQNDLLRVCLNTRVISILFDPGFGSVTGLKVISGSSEFTITPKRIVICCGGIQSARLLLLMQRDNPNFLGGEAGPLGRYYSGHLSGGIARICFNRPEQARSYIVRRETNDYYSRGLFQVTEDSQKRYELLNLYFGLSNLPLSDAGCQNGALSAIHLALSARHRTAHYMSHYHPGHIETEFEFSLDSLAHLRNIAANPLNTIRDLAKIVRTRASSAETLPFFSFFNPSGKYVLGYHAEQVPDPNSRVTLSDSVDANGIPLPHVDRRVSDADVESILKSHQVLDRWLRQTGFGRIDWYQPENLRAAHIRSTSNDGYHQIGLTRMCRSAREGVVDENLRVHGIDNLFLVSAGILPTGGRAHPTFPAITLGIRLADQMAS